MTSHKQKTLLFTQSEDIGPDCVVMGIDHFKASAPGDVLLREIGFTSDDVVRRAKEFLKRQEAT